MLQEGVHKMADDQDIYCRIFEKEEIAIQFDEETIHVHVDNMGGGSSAITPETLVQGISTYLLLEDLTSQVNGADTDFILNYKIQKIFGIWVNGLKERIFTVVDEKTIRVTPALKFNISEKFHRSSYARKNNKSSWWQSNKKFVYYS
jgi:hypothetical protein